MRKKTAPRPEKGRRHTLKVTVLHRAKGQLQLGLGRRRLSAEEADTLYYALTEQPGVRSVSVLYRTAQVLLRFDPCVPDASARTIAFLRGADLSDPELKKLVPAVSGRATNEQFKQEIGELIMKRVAKRLLLPAPVRYAWTVWNGLPFIREGLRDLAQKRFSAEIVHASAIAASLLTADFPTAGSIIFLTKLGEILEEWTYKKSVDDLARSLALNVTNVWRVEGDTTVLVPLGQVKVGDRIHVYMGSVIPLDGVVAAMVNQSALTGESVPVHKEVGLTVYAGTVIDEGDLVIEVRETSGQTRYDNIVKFIERSESMVAVTQSQAERLVSRPAAEESLFPSGKYRL